MDNNIIYKRTVTHICANCGGADGIHQFETMKCPKNGIEETRVNFQQWLETTFEDSGLKEFTEKAVSEYESLVKANRELLEALKLLKQAYDAGITLNSENYSKIELYVK